MAVVSRNVLQCIKRFFNYKIIANDDERFMRKVLIPGFSYADMDRTGQVNLCSLNRMLETSRLLPHVMKELEFLFRPTEKSVFVMLGQRFTVQPQLVQNCCMDYPMELENRFVGISKSALVKKASLLDAKTGSVIVSVLQKLVLMDLATKKACNLTPDIVKLCNTSMGGGEIFKPITPLPPPPTAFTSTQMVKHSDMDYLLHTNQGTYLRYAFDSAAEAAFKDAFSVIKKDVCHYQALEANMLNMSETFAGDLLTVKVWEDSTDPFTLHCIIFKGKITVFYVNMKFTNDFV